MISLKYKIKIGPWEGTENEDGDFHRLIDKRARHLHAKKE